MCSQIPVELMNAKNESIIHVYNRFAWIDNRFIKVRSRDGIERIIDTADKSFKEIGYSVVQMLNRSSCEKYHIFKEVPSFLLSETCERLIKKYRIYKRETDLNSSKPD